MGFGKREIRMATIAGDLRTWARSTWRLSGASNHLVNGLIPLRPGWIGANVEAPSGLRGCLKIDSLDLTQHSYPAPLQPASPVFMPIFVQGSDIDRFSTPQQAAKPCVKADPAGSGQRR